MGCGKTRVGKALANEMKRPFVDVDEQIVKKAGMSISDIFAKYGEAYFRELETKELKEVLENKEQMIIASGGGIPMQEANLPLLKEGIVVYIEASTEVLLPRLERDKKRPILQGGDLCEKITSLMEVRGPVYEEISDIKIATTNEAVIKIVQQIVEKLVEKNV